MYITDIEKISSHTLSKDTFFSLVFDLHATSTTNYHKNQKMKNNNNKKTCCWLGSETFLFKFTKCFFFSLE